LSSSTGSRDPRHTHSPPTRRSSDLSCIAQHYGGGPVGAETLAAALSEQRDVIEEVIEPYLLQQGFIQRTPRGRLLTQTAYAHMGLEAPRALMEQLDLLALGEPEDEESAG